MKKTKITTAIIFMLALTVLAGEALAGPGGRGRSRGGQGWGGGPGWGRGMTGGPQMKANNDPAQPDDSWRPGPYCPWGQGPNQNIQPRQGRGPGGFGRGYWGPQGPYCPFGQGPNQNIQGRQGRGWGGYGQGPNQNIQGRRGRGPGRFGQGFQGRDGRAFQGPGATIQGRGSRGFQRRNIAPQGWGINGRRGQFRHGGMGRPGPNMQPQRFAPGDTDQPMPPRGGDWAPGSGRGWRQGMGQGRRQGMGPGWGQGQQPENAPDVNAPQPPIVENQTEKPQGE